MKFADAKSFRLDFNRFRGMAIDEIAQTDEGLKFLDWLVGQPWMRAKQYREVREALTVYLSDPAIARELVNLVGDGS